MSRNISLTLLAKYEGLTQCIVMSKSITGILNNDNSDNTSSPLNVYQLLYRGCVVGIRNNQNIQLAYPRLAGSQPPLHIDVPTFTADSAHRR